MKYRSNLIKRVFIKRIPNDGSVNKWVTVVEFTNNEYMHFEQPNYERAKKDYEIIIRYYDRDCMYWIGSNLKSHKTWLKKYKLI